VFHGADIPWYRFALLSYLPDHDSVIQLLKETNKFLELLGDIVR
jgi:hypothetical protein